MAGCNPQEAAWDPKMYCIGLPKLPTFLRGRIGPHGGLLGLPRDRVELPIQLILLSMSLVEISENDYVVVFD